MIVGYHRKQVVCLDSLKRGKFKAVFRYLLCPTYRRSVNYMRDLMTYEPYELHHRELELCLIRSSHNLNYPKWVNTLVRRIEDWEGLYRPKPMKVMYDWRRNDGTYMIIDGNHRLAALKRVFSPGFVVLVHELLPIGFKTS